MLLTGKLKEENIGRIPNIYELNDALDRQTKQFREEMEKWKTTSQYAITFPEITNSYFRKLQESYDKVKKERDFHRMHHKRVGQEKNKLSSELKKLTERQDKFKQEAEEWHAKYESIRKEKILIQIDKDKLTKRIMELENGHSATPEKVPVSSLNATTRSPGKSAKTTNSITDSKRKNVKEQFVASENRPNPWLEKSIAPSQKFTGNGFKLAKSFKAHDTTISA